MSSFNNRGFRKIFKDQKKVFKYRTRWSFQFFSLVNIELM